MQPCDEMTIISNIRERAINIKGMYGIGIQYQFRSYKQILNRKAFDGNTLLSQVGGYIGIFLGVSLSQAPGIILSFIHKIKHTIPGYYKEWTETNNRIENKIEKI